MWGEDTPAEPDSLAEEEEEEGGVTAPPPSMPRETPQHSVISSAGKRGSQSACASRSGPEQRLGRRSACLSDPVSRWYLLTQGGQALCPC
jgi:hypothetical protein